MVTKLLVVTTAPSAKVAYSQATEFIEGFHPLFNDYSIVKCISQNNKVNENLGYDTLDFDENKDYWYEEFTKHEDFGKVDFNDWIKENKILLENIETFEDVKTYSKLIASQYLIYQNDVDYINKAFSKFTFKKTLSILIRNLKYNYNYLLYKILNNKKKLKEIDIVNKINLVEDRPDFDYVFFREYYTIMDELTSFGTIKPSEFNLLRHRFFPCYFGFDQIAHHEFNRYSDEHSPENTWVVLAEIEW